MYSLTLSFPCVFVEASHYTVGVVQAASSGGGTTGKVDRMVRDEMRYDGKLTSFEITAQSAGAIVIAVSVSVYYSLYMPSIKNVVQV